jgi:hypothetical protein
VADSENAGTVQRVVGHLSQEEQNMVATVGQNCSQKPRRARQGLNRKEICRSKCDTHKIERTKRVKGKNLILKLWAGLDGSPGWKTVQEKLATILQNMS